MNRRELVRRVGGVAGGALIAGCSSVENSVSSVDNGNSKSSETQTIPGGESRTTDETVSPAEDQEDISTEITGVPLPGMEKAANLPGGHISDVKFSLSNSDTLYLASNVNAMGVWKSENRGESWQKVFYDSNFGATHSNTVSIHPESANIVLVSDLHGHISRTTDGGRSWERVFGSSSPMFAVQFSESTPEISYAADEAGNLFKSLDEGKSWEKIATASSQGVGSLAVAPDDSERLYAGSRNGAYVSVDGGFNWEKSYPAQGHSEVVSITVSPTQPNTVLVATPRGIDISTDRGTSWTRTLNQHSHSIQVARSNPNRLYAGTNDGVYKSDDGGNTWSQQSRGIRYKDIGPLTINPTDADQVVIGSNIWQWTFHWDPFPNSTESEGIYRTTNGAESWSKTSKGFLDADVIAIATDPANPNIVYAGVECSRGIFRSVNGGDSWEFISGGPESGSWDIGHYTMRLTTDVNGALYMTGRFGFSRSTNRGDSWSATPVRRHFHGIGINPHDPNTIFIGSSPKQDPTESDDYPGGRILRSQDAGRSWQEVGSGFPSGAHTSIHDFAFDATDQKRVYVSTSRHEIGLPDTERSVGVYRSDDNGQSWAEVNSGLPTMDVDNLSSSPATSGQIFAASEQGIYRSDNFGENWEFTGLDLTSRSVLVDPSNGDSVYAGTENGLFWSKNGGSTWDRIEAVPTEPVASLTMDPAGRVLFAAVNDVGIYKAINIGK